MKFGVNVLIGIKLTIRNSVTEQNSTPSFRVFQTIDDAAAACAKLAASEAEMQNLAVVAGIKKK